MSEESVDLVRRGAEVFRREGLEAWLSGFVAEDAVYVQDSSVGPEARTWHGHAGWREAVGEWTSEFHEWGFDFHEVLDTPDDRAVLIWSDEGRGTRSGVRVQRRRAAFVHTVRDGRIVHTVQYARAEDALAAVGLG